MFTPTVHKNKILPRNFNSKQYVIVACDISKSNKFSTLEILNKIIMTSVAHHCALWHENPMTS